VNVRGSRYPVAGAREGEKHTVSRPVDLGSAVLARRRADELAHPRARLTESLAEQVQEAGRALDVGEQQRDGSGWKGDS
jgi:hypothetical protein